jgi:hypothetical protein
VFDRKHHLEITQLVFAPRLTERLFLNHSENTAFGQPRFLVESQLPWPTARGITKKSLEEDLQKSLSLNVLELENLL